MGWFGVGGFALPEDGARGVLVAGTSCGAEAAGVTGAAVGAMRALARPPRVEKED